MLFSKYYPDYFTATILEWKPFLKKNKYKEIIIFSLEFLVKEKRIKVYALAIMNNHIDVICTCKPFLTKNIQLSFMKYTAQMIIKDLRDNHQEVLEIFKVKASAKNTKYGKESIKRFIMVTTCI